MDPDRAYQGAADDYINYESVGYVYIGASYVYIWRYIYDPLDITKVIVLGEVCSSLALTYHSFWYPSSDDF